MGYLSEIIRLCVYLSFNFVSVIFAEIVYKMMYGTLCKWKVSRIKYNYCFLCIHRPLVGRGSMNEHTTRELRTLDMQLPSKNGSMFIQQK